jgi:WXG100 family type VII secretion target
MEADLSVIAGESANFQRIADELRAVMAHVEATASGLQPAWVGASATAAQAALLRFHEAATQQNRELDDISQNLGIGGTQYGSTDDDQASALASRML